MRFCKKEKQSVQEIETVVSRWRPLWIIMTSAHSLQLTAIQAVNILLRDNPAQRFTPIGARGRFFGMGTYCLHLPGPLLTVRRRQRPHLQRWSRRQGFRPVSL